MVWLYDWPSECFVQLLWQWSCFCLTLAWLLTGDNGDDGDDGDTAAEDGEGDRDDVSGRPLSYINWAWWQHGHDIMDAGAHSAMAYLHPVSSHQS